MARWRFAATFLLTFMAFGYAPALGQGPVGIGLVNTETILRQTPGYGAADSTLAIALQGWQDEMQALEAQRDSMQLAFEQQELVLSPQAREEKVNEIRALIQRGQTRQTEIQQQIADLQGELVAPLEARIQAVIDGLRAERNIAIIFDVANPNSAILSADLSLNLTEVVIQRLQAAGGP